MTYMLNRDQILTADDIPPTFSSCPLLYVNCVNTDQSRYFYKGYCGVYYCADGLCKYSFIFLLLLYVLQYKIKVKEFKRFLTT